MRNTEQKCSETVQRIARFSTNFIHVSVEICLSSLILTREGFGEFETVMQTRDEVEGLHNFREFSQPPECLDEAM